MNLVSGNLNIIFGWCWINIGFIMGMVMGMKFEKANWLSGYASWERRMLRLSHVAFIFLSILNIVYGHELINVNLSASWKQAGSILIIIGAIGIPTVVFTAAFYKKILYWLAIPIIALTSSTLIMAIGYLK